MGAIKETCPNCAEAYHRGYCEAMEFWQKEMQRLLSIVPVSTTVKISIKKKKILEEIIKNNTCIAIGIDCPECPLVDFECKDEAGVVQEAQRQLKMMEGNL